MLQEICGEIFGRSKNTSDANSCCVTPASAPRTSKSLRRPLACFEACRSEPMESKRGWLRTIDFIDSIQLLPLMSRAMHRSKRGASVDEIENVHSAVRGVLRRLVGAEDPEYEDLVQSSIEHVLVSFERGSFRGDCPQGAGPPSSRATSPSTPFAPGVARGSSSPVTRPMWPPRTACGERTRRWDPSI